MSIDLSSFEGLVGYATSLEIDQALCLLPVRLETRFVQADASGPRRLMVRVFPDDIHVDAHLTTLSQEERDITLNFRDRFDNGALSEDQKRALWSQYVTLVGSARAAYLGGLTIDELYQADLSDEGRWRAPYARCLPSHWVAVGYRQGVRVKVVVGATIDPSYTSGMNDALSMGPDFNLASQLSTDEPLALLPSWMFDLSIAEAIGMALRMELGNTPEDDLIWSEGLDQLLVFGLNIQDSASEGATKLSALLSAHALSQGLDQVMPHAAASATVATRSGYGGESPDELYARGFCTPAIPDAGAAQSEASRLIRALGLPGQGQGPEQGHLNYMSFAREALDDATRHMHTMLWPVGLGYYTEQLLAPLTGWDERRILRAQYLESVRGLGPLATLRTGPQPYGVLPVVALSQYQPALDVPSGLGEFEFPMHAQCSQLTSSAEPELQGAQPWSRDDVLSFLNQLKATWLQQGLPQVPHIGPGALDPQGTMLQIIAQQPSATQLRERPVMGSELYQVMAQSAAWPVASSLWQDDAADTIHGLLDQLGLRTALRAPNASPRLARMYPMCLSQPVSAPAVSSDDGPASLKASVYLDLLGALDIQTVIDEQATLSALQSTAQDLPLLAMLTRRSLEQTIQSCAWMIAWRRDRLTDFVPITPELTGLPTGNTPGFVPLETILSLSLGDLGIDAASLSTSDTLAQALDLVRQQATISGDDPQVIADTLFLGTVEAFEIDELLELYRALKGLHGLEEDKLTLLLEQGLDVCTHRLDAWWTSLATRRLMYLRQSQPVGIHMGGYGVLEDVRPGKSLTPLGVIHAPSQAQAQTAAVIKSGQLQHQGTSRDGLLQIDLSSRRVRDAMTIVDAMREGRTMGAVLGERVEHELKRRAIGSLSSARRLLTPLRRAYPTHSTNLKLDAGDSAALGQDQAVDGLQLLRAFEDSGEEMLWGVINTSLSELDGSDLSPNERALVVQLVQQLHDSVDALHDLMLAEGVHQSTQGNHARAKAALDVMSGSAAPPMEVELVQTPRAGRMLTHRVALLVNAQQSTQPSYAWGHEGQSVRVQLAPELAAWVETWLPHPERYVCVVTGYAQSGQRMQHQMSLRELELSALDLMSCLVDSKQSGEGVIESLVLSRWSKRLAALGVGLDATRQLKIDWAPKHLAPGYKSFQALFGLVSMMRATLLSARALEARDLVSPGASLSDERGWQQTEAVGRVQQVIDVMTQAQDTITMQLMFLTTQLDALAAVNDNRQHWSSPEAPDLQVGMGLWQLPQGSDVEALGALAHQANPSFMSQTQRELARQLLEQLALCGLEGVTAALAHQVAAQDAGVLCAKLVQALSALQGVLSRLQWPSQPTMDQCVAALRTLLGEGVVWTPTITLTNSQLGTSLSAQGSLLDGDDRRAGLWLAKVAHVREGAGRLAQTRLIARDAGALEAGIDSELLVAQLPYHAQGHWLADSAGQGQESAQSLSLMCWADEPTRASVSAQSNVFRGLWLDEWVEQLPDALQTTGAAIHAPSPKARAPQALLLAVPPELGQAWTLETVEATVRESLELAKVRAVDPQALGSLSHLLPTLYLPFTTITDDIIIDG